MKGDQKFGVRPDGSRLLNDGGQKRKPMMAVDMVREHRYVVAKIKDLAKHLNLNEINMLNLFLDKVADGRRGEGKEPLQCVVVEQDWPEYEPTWKAIEKRVDSEK